MTPQYPDKQTSKENLRESMAKDVIRLVAEVNNSSFNDIDRNRARYSLDAKFIEWLKFETGTVYPDKDGKAKLPIRTSDGTAATFVVDSVGRLEAGLVATNFAEGIEKQNWTGFLEGFTEAVFNGIKSNNKSYEELTRLAGDKETEERNKKIEKLAGETVCVQGIAGRLLNSLSGDWEVEPEIDSTIVNSVRSVARQSITQEQQGLNNTSTIIAKEIGVEVAKALEGILKNRQGAVSGPGVSGELDEYLRSTAEYNSRKGRLEKNIESVSLGELLDSYIGIKAPRERAPQMWEYQVPGWAEGMSVEDWRGLLSFEDRWLSAVYSKRGDALYNNDLEKMKQSILSKESCYEQDLKKWYDHPLVNLKGVMHEIMKELLVPRKYIAKMVGNVLEERTIYVFATEKERGKEQFSYSSQNVRDFVANSTTYKNQLAERLNKKGVVKSLEMAKMSVALAMGIMEMGGVFSSADVLRMLGWESDVIRLVQQPANKFSSKIGGGEIWGGPWTEYCLAVSGGDGEKASQILKNLGIIPELLSGSFLDLRRKRDKESFANRIYRDEKIDFDDVANDLFFLWRKDHVMSAADLWGYIARKSPFELSKVREFDNAATDWRIGLFNAIRQLKKNNDALVTTSVIAGAIGGSVGLWPFAGPYLRLNPVGGEPGGFAKYNAVSTQLIEGLGLQQADVLELKRFFGIDFKYAVDFGDRSIDYITLLNPRTSGSFREKIKERLLKPRKNFL